MRKIPKRPTIEERGLRNHLDENRQLHNDYGYDEFVKRVGLDEPKTVMARAFNVSTDTIYSWLEIYEKESVK